MKITVKAKVLSAHEKVDFIWEAIGAGRAVPKSLPSSMAIWQTLAAGLALWLTLSPSAPGRKRWLPSGSESQHNSMGKDPEGFLRNPSSSTLRNKPSEEDALY